MKRLTAISFLIILSFNIFGYRYAIRLLATKADSNLEFQIDNLQYDESQLVELRVDLNMPYQERFTDFERHYGEISIEGKPYTYVMRKIEGTILVLKCIRNISREQLTNTSDEITKANSNQEQNTNSQKQNSTLLKVIKGDYFNNHSLAQTIFNPDSKPTFQLAQITDLPEIAILPPQQPPRC